MIFELLRYSIYFLIVYNVYSVSGWISLGLGIAFILGEAGIYLSVKHTNRLKAVEEKTDTPRMPTGEIHALGLGFSFDPFTVKEKELVAEIKKGDRIAIGEFLNSRCDNKEIDFTTDDFFPEEVKELIATSVIDEVEERSDDDWDDELLED